MHNTYISSTVLSVRNKGSFSLSSNDCSTLLHQRFERIPSLSSCQFYSCCNCCSCCSSSSFGTQRLQLLPSLVYGLGPLRQSTLIQCSPSRRLILGGRDRYYYQVLAYGLDHGCHEVYCSEGSGGERIGRRRNERIRHVKSRERRCLSGFDDVDAVISLLSEEVSEEYLGDRERNESLLERAKVWKKGNYGGECHRQRKMNVRLGLLDNDSKREFESVTVDSRKELHTRKEEREDNEWRENKQEKEERVSTFKGENHRGRKSSSSISSYYSLSSAEDFDSDKESEDVNSGILKESSGGRRKESRSRDDEYVEQVVEKYKEHRGREEKEGQVVEQGATASNIGVQWDLRKKSEKKLTDVEETQYRKKSSQMHSKLEARSAKYYKNGSNAYKQVDDEEEKSELAANLEKERRMLHGQMGNQVVEQSELIRNYKETTDIQEIHGRNVERTSQHQKHFSSREENLTEDTELFLERRDRRHKTVGESGGKDHLKRDTRLVSGRSEIGISDANRVSTLQRQSESSSVLDVNKQSHQRGERILGKIESSSSQKFSETSEIHDHYGKKISILQSEARMKNREGSANIVSTSEAETKDQRFQTNKNSVPSIQSGKAPQDVTNIAVNVTNVSVLHASNTESITNSQSISEQTIINQGNILTSSAKAFQEKRERDNQVAESATQDKSRKEVQTASKVSSAHEKISEEAFSSQASLKLDSQARLQHIDVEDQDQESSQIVMMPPSPQLLRRDALRAHSNSRMANQEVSRENLESSQGASYRSPGGRTPVSHQETYASDRTGSSREPLNLPSPKDALGSAHRLEESSMHFVEEFVEKARQEASTSEIEKEKTVSETTLVYEGEKHKQKSSSEIGYKELHLEDQDQRRSSGGSGVKGPSDEMWHVMDPTVEEPIKTEAPEESTDTKNSSVTRTGSSLWSIIANIVRLRWGSRPETPISTRKSGGKSVSNDSVSSDAWFSGHEPDENSEKNVKGGNVGMQKEANSSHQLLSRQTSSQGQGETSGTFGSKDSIGQLEVDMSLPSIILKSGSTSKRISSPSEEENLSWSGNGLSSQVIPSGMEVRESSLVSLPSSILSSPMVEEGSGALKSAAFGSGFMETKGQPAAAKLPEVPGNDEKEGELKQRRLQRNKQVLRDRFDEWEEAYIHETEQRKLDEMFMREALLEARKAADTWEVPVGAVLVHDGKIIARGYNLVEELRDSTAHAEMICIREASNQLRTWRLAGTTLYVTLEPCPMCAGAILQARVGTLVWGAPNKLLGADGSWIRLFPNGGEGSGLEKSDKPPPPVHPFHPKMTIRRGILAADCADAMRQFFQLRRRKKEKNEDIHAEPSCLPIATRPTKFLDKMQHIFHIMFCL